MGWGSGWRRRTAMAGAFVLFGTALVLPGTFATGEMGDTFGTEGILRLHFGAQDYFRFVPADGGDPTQTNVSGSSCKASLTPVAPSTANLVALSPTPSTASVGFQPKVDSLGIKTAAEGGGTSCSQVNGTSQALTISLAGVLADKVADLAELDIEFKFNAKVKAEMFLDGSSVGTQVFDCLHSDCGPDSGGSDNYRLLITGFLFDAIKLSVDPSTPAGAFSLEGGADGGPIGPVGETLPDNKGDSIFRISGADGILDCNQTAPTETGGPGEPDATLTRGDNTDASGCQKILYTLETSSDSDSQDVVFIKDLSQQPKASFVIEIDWDAQPESYPLAAVQVDETPDTPEGLYDPEWCDGTFDKDNIQGSTPSLSQASQDAGQHWCVAYEEAHSVGNEQAPNYEKRTTYFFGEGDPLFTLPKLG